MFKRIAPTLALAAATSFALIAPSHALTLTNADTVDQKVVIIQPGEKAMSVEVVLKAGQTLQEVCMEGCIISLNSGEEVQFEGTEKVQIADGAFVIDDKS